MAAYETYKDSGVKWLGTIPSHWELRKIKFTFDEKSVKGFPNEPLLAATQKYGVIKKEDYESRTVEAIKGRESLKLVEKDDFVISLRSFQGGIERSYERGIISTAYTILRPTHITPEYFKYLGKSPQFIKLLQSMVTGIREGQNIDYSRLKNEYIAIPPLAKQEAIVAYLDKVTGKIDRAIEVQQQMIDALNERIQIIISRAVTKGLNLDAKIGKDGFPAHWEVFPLRYAMSIRNGYTPSKANPAFWENGTIPWYRMEDIRKSGRMLNEAIQCVTPKAVKSAGTFDAGSFILAICTASIGEHAMLIADSLANQQFANLKIRKSLSARINPMFMFYYMYVIGDFCRNNANSTCFQYVDMSGLKRFPVPIPRPEEQEAIVDYLNTNTAGIKQQIANCQRMIDLLTERKQIIINQVVTGKEKVI